MLIPHLLVPVIINVRYFEKVTHSTIDLKEGILIFLKSNDKSNCKFFKSHSPPSGYIKASEGVLHEIR